MADRPELPDKDQLEKLFRTLLDPEEEMDEVDVDLMLELYGIDPRSLKDDLRVKLEREVEELRAQGAEVPPVMLEVLDSLQPKSQAKDHAADQAAHNPEVWIDNLLRGAMPASLTGIGQAVHLQSFRARNMEALSQEDQQILHELAAEIKAETEEKED